jgi:hypothetical protein
VDCWLDKGADKEPGQLCSGFLPRCGLGDGGELESWEGSSMLGQIEYVYPLRHVDGGKRGRCDG